jgi:ubiquinone/menaquinone biosynthesis C-methylase UbiE
MGHMESSGDERSLRDDEAERERLTRQMYSQLRYPSLDPQHKASYENHRLLIYRLLGIDPTTFFQGKIILDGGCGTGEETMFLASLGPEKVIGIDTSDGSLESARNRAKEAGIENVEFRHASVLDDKVFADGTFDYVSSLGCIHHTPRMRQAFDNLCRMVKPDGYLCTFLYNLECDWLDRVAGDDIDERIRLARRYLDWRRGTSFRREGIPSSWDARLFDKYAVLYRDSLTLKQLLGWYQEQGLEEVGSYPMRFGDMIAAYRAHSGDEMQSIRGVVARVLSPLATTSSGSRRWVWRRRVWMQSLLFLLGLYDYGGAFRVLAQKQAKE